MEPTLVRDDGKGIGGAEAGAYCQKEDSSFLEIGVMRANMCQASSKCFQNI